MWSPDEVAFVALTYRGDVRYCRALLASLRYFYPEHHIVIVVDGDLRDPNLGRWKNVRIVRSADIATRLGIDVTGYLAKLAVLFLDDHPAYAYFDADSILVSPLFDIAMLQEQADFYALGGRWLDLAAPEERAFLERDLKVDEVRKLVDPDFIYSPLLGFLAGNFVFRRGIVPLDLVARNMEHISRDWDGSKVFHLNDQSFLLYAINKLHYERGLVVRSGDAMVIPRGRELARFPDITAANVAARRPLSRPILHWTAPSRHPRFTDHGFGDCLCFFEDLYYADLAWWERRRDTLALRYRQLSRRARGRWSYERDRRRTHRAP